MRLSLSLRRRGARACDSPAMHRARIGAADSQQILHVHVHLLYVSVGYLLRRLAVMPA